MRKKQRVIAGASLAAGLVAGGGAGLIIGASTGSAGAASASPAAVTDPTTPATPTDPSAPVTPKPAVDREQRVRDLLQPLVDDGTITSAQLDAILAKLATAEPATGHDGPGRGGPGAPGGRGMRGILAVDADTVATTLGISADDVRTAIKDGTTLKALAESKGKTAQDVIDALVAATKTQLDQRVTDGKLTQDQADTMLTEATTGITAIVNDGFPKGFPMGPGGERHAKPGDSSGEGSTPSSTPSTTTG